MIATISGTRYRLHFEHEEVPTRYNGPAERAKGKRNKKSENPKQAVILRTQCGLQIDSGQVDADKRTIWIEVASSVVYLNHQDLRVASKREGKLSAFNKLMASFLAIERENKTPPLFSSQRAELAKQFIAHLPKRKTVGALKRTIRALRAEVERLKALVPKDVTEMTTEEYLASHSATPMVINK